MSLKRPNGEMVRWQRTACRGPDDATKCQRGGEVRQRPGTVAHRRCAPCASIRHYRESVELWEFRRGVVQ